MLTHRHLDFAGQHIYELFPFVLVADPFVLLEGINGDAKRLSMFVFGTGR